MCFSNGKCCIYICHHHHDHHHQCVPKVRVPLSLSFSLTLFSVAQFGVSNINNTVTYTKHKPTLSFEVTTGFLIPDFGPWRHEERDTILKSLF